MRGAFLFNGRSMTTRTVRFCDVCGEPISDEYHALSIRTSFVKGGRQELSPTDVDLEICIECFNAPINIKNVILAIT